MVKFFVLFPTTLWALCSAYLLVIHQEALLLPLTVGTFLGIVNFLFLERSIQNLLSGGRKIAFIRFLCVGFAFFVAAWFIDHPLGLILGFTFHPLSLMVYAVKEFLHA